eukprot:TRINITY_DN17303_c0_g1_i1.p1 TRINITY_DN17303_c0_g1~~TRINITY_DN17303_c0_g1_i1.p1  ORF type:complete len:364 (+),score=55.01 TRINITY_DN17303_c0_g1_i1:215-1306(+)
MLSKRSRVALMQRDVDDTRRCRRRRQLLRAVAAATAGAATAANCCTVGFSLTRSSYATPANNLRKVPGVFAGFILLDCSAGATRRYVVRHPGPTDICAPAPWCATVQRCATRSVDATSTKTVLQGKFRALGRLVGIVGQRLVDGAPSVGISTFAPLGGAVAALAREEGTDGRRLGASLRDCGTVLQSVATSLLEENLAVADDFLRDAKLDCADFFQREHIASLQALLRGSSGQLDAQDIIASLAQDLELRAAGLNMDSVKLQRVLFDAAGALRSAARLFVSLDSPQTVGEVSAAAFADSSQPLPRSVEAIKRVVAWVAPSERTSLLRTLARRYHPDRNRGREMEFLPLFLYVQKLREEGAPWL